MDQQQSEMQGGWARGAIKVGKLEQRLTARQAKGEHVKLNSKTGDISLNKARSFKATIDGVPLKGFGKITKTDKKTGVKTTLEGETNRYFHGDPSGAARKVIAILHKGQKKSLPGSRNVEDISNAVKITLTEVTKGVRRAKIDPKTMNDKFTYTYYGWREKVPLSEQKAHPTAVYPVGHPLAGQSVKFAARNRVVPARGAASASTALSASQNIGKEIKRLKELPVAERVAVAAQKKATKKAQSEARKVAKKVSA